mmetsp:Transcript_46317/g.145315  ORF Transcript_46317/g.145315 Transcript_46317/m.145315 type:complete len:405 (+) Transcript_46317:336-1550(+)
MLQPPVRHHRPEDKRIAVCESRARVPAGSEFLSWSERIRRRVGVRAFDESHVKEPPVGVRPLLPQLRTAALELFIDIQDGDEALSSSIESSRHVLVLVRNVLHVLLSSLALLRLEADEVAGPLQLLLELHPPSHVLPELLGELLNCSGLLGLSLQSFSLSVVLVGQQRLVHDVSAEALPEMSQHKRTIDDKLRFSRRESSCKHARQLMHGDAILVASSRESRSVDHEALCVHPSSPCPSRHLPELICPVPPVSLSLVVGFVQLTEDNAPGRHVDPDGQRLRGKDDLDETSLEAELHVLAQDRQHACMMIRDASFQELVQLLKCFQPVELSTKAPKVLSLHRKQLSLNDANPMASFSFFILPLQKLFQLFTGRFLFRSHTQQGIPLHREGGIDAQLTGHAKNDCR